MLFHTILVKYLKSDVTSGSFATFLPYEGIVANCYEKGSATVFVVIASISLVVVPVNVFIYDSFVTVFF